MVGGPGGIEPEHVGAIADQRGGVRRRLHGRTDYLVVEALRQLASRHEGRHNVGLAPHATRAGRSARELLGRSVGYRVTLGLDALLPILSRADDGLSVAEGLASGGLLTVLLGPLSPYHFEHLPRTGWVRSIHFFLLDCSGAVRRERLEARPPWRERQIDEQIRWSAWLREDMQGADTGHPVQLAWRGER